MQLQKYLYTYRYHETERALCRLESKYLFGKEDSNKLLFSDIAIEPSSSAFIKQRIELISTSDDYAGLLSEIKKHGIRKDGFKIEYKVLEGDNTPYGDRLAKLRDIGIIIEGRAEYHHPTTVYALCLYEGIWCFGILVKDAYDWDEHNKKPCSFSNSISINVAKTLVNIAAQGNKNHKILDACCGVGTIMLEACFAGYEIEGCDINWKMSTHAKVNLAHFEYKAKVHHCDIQALESKYEAAIIDLPYNLYSKASDADIVHIIEATTALTNRFVIVSTSDITDIISTIGLQITDYCSVKKIGKSTFTRKIWICEGV